MIDATPSALPADYIIIQDDEGYYVPALKVPGIVYSDGDLVNVLFIKGTEPIAFQQGAGSPSSPSASVTIRKNTGSNVGSRPRLNFVEGTSITLTITDDAINDEVDIIINSPDDIPESIINAKGDLIVGTADDTPAILPVSGNDGWVLTEDSGEATGLKWAAASGASSDNIFLNGAFDVWQRSTNDTGVTTAAKYVADRWYVATSAGTLANVQRSATVRTGARSKYSLELVGATGVTAVDIGQRIESIYLANYKRTVAFSGYIYNGSGADFTPTLFALTPNGLDAWTTSTVRNGGGSGESLQSCINGQWTQVTWSADVSGYTNIANGFGIDIQIPSGSLVAGDTVRFAEMNLIPGAAFPPMALTDYIQELGRCQRYCFALDASTTASQGQGAKATTTVIAIMLKTPVTLRIAPTALTHNITGYTAGAPGTTTVALLDYVANNFFTISGALSAEFGNANREYVTLLFRAGTSWNGVQGSLAALQLGPGVVAYLSVEL